MYAIKFNSLSLSNKISGHKFKRVIRKTTDAPGTASTVDMDTNKHVLNSLNNIDQTMVKMAGLIAKFAGQAAGKESKRSADPQSDTDESES